MTRTEAIVFDMDGVLIDSEELHAHAKRIALAHAGIALSDAELRSYVGRSDAVMIDEIGARYGLTDGQRSKILNEKKRILGRYGFTCESCGSLKSLKLEPASPYRKLWHALY